MKLLILILILIFNYAEIAMGVPHSHVDVIAHTIYYEARGESHKGKLAVASVIYNRCYSRYGGFITPLNLRNVCLRKFQFSCWNSKIKKITKNKTYRKCYEIALRMVNGHFVPIGRWNHYYNPKKCNPRWAKKMTMVKIIDNHRFGLL